MRRKLALDATNELLNQPTEDPAADKEYQNPWFYKGSEPRQDYIDRKASNGRNSLEQRFKSKVPIVDRTQIVLDYKNHKITNVKGKPNWYVEDMPQQIFPSRRAAEEAIDRKLALREELSKSAFATPGCSIDAIKGMSIDELRTFRKELDHVLYDKMTGGDDSDLDANHEMYFGKRPSRRAARDLTAALRRQAEIKKKAEIEMHTAPDMLPPRQDMRSRVDKDLKAEQEADMNTDDLYKKMGFDKTAGLKKIKWIYHSRFGKHPCWAADVTGKPTLNHSDIYEQAMKGEKRAIPIDSVCKGVAFLRDNGECTAVWELQTGKSPIADSGSDGKMFENIEGQLKKQFGAKAVKWAQPGEKAARVASARAYADTLK